MVATEAAGYSGQGNGPDADAAFQNANAMTGAVSIGIAGADGNTWKQVN